MLAPQESKSRPGWWKGNFALFQMLATGGGGRVVDICLKAYSPRWEAAGKSFYRQSGDWGHMQKQHSPL